MEKKITHLPINWIDGMKINKTHFIGERNAMLQQIAYSSGSHITDINYGLLPKVAEEQEDLKYVINLDNQQYVNIKVLNCRAITAGGAFMDINNDKYTVDEWSVKIPELSVSYESLAKQSKQYNVVLTINLYDRDSIGNADENEIPPRLPYSIPKYSISLIPNEEFNNKKTGLYQITLAQINLNDNKLEVNENYIPPCTSPLSHPVLTDVYYGIEEFIKKMELYSIQINQKINQKKQNNELALIVENVCNNIIQFQNVHFTNFKWIAIHQPPVHMLSYVTSLARLIKNTFDLYVNCGKEELMNYFAEWCDVNQAKFEASVTDLCNYNYIHEDINDILNKVSDFTKIVSSLFNKLSKLDYIGKKRDANIFVKEEIVDENTAETAAKKRRSFLAD